MTKPKFSAPSAGRKFGGFIQKSWKRGGFLLNKIKNFGVGVLLKKKEILGLLKEIETSSGIAAESAVLEDKIK